MPRGSRRSRFDALLAYAANPTQVRLFREREAAADWEGILIVLPIPLFALWLECEGARLDDSTYWRLLEQAWVKAEAPSTMERTWSRLFANPRPGRLEYSLSEADAELLASAFDGDRPAVVWRGTTTAERNPAYRLSWTTDPETAEWFARRFPSRYRPVVWRGEVDRSAVLLASAARGEAELVIVPGCVRRLTRRILERGD